MHDGVRQDLLERVQKIKQIQDSVAWSNPSAQIQAVLFNGMIDSPR
jgi:hypothetical protein